MRKVFHYDESHGFVHRLKGMRLTFLQIVRARINFNFSSKCNFIRRDVIKIKTRPGLMGRLKAIN